MDWFEGANRSHEETVDGGDKVSRGIASSRGAVTILNAIPTGIGAALGITLQTDAEVEIKRGLPGIEVVLPEKGETDSMAKECIREVFHCLGREQECVSVKTRSTIPISRGLKSSSAAANAITLASVRALDAHVDDVDIVKIGVEAAKRSGVTVTGAFDDAMACYFGGIAVTDNSEMAVIRRTVLRQKNLRVILHIPDRKIRKEGLSSDTFKPFFKDFKEVEELVLDGEYLEALTRNGELVAKALDIENDVAEAAMKAGAMAAGITGTGPATAILCRESSFYSLLDSIPHGEGVMITAHLNEIPAPEVKPWLLES
jgi:shikimate kinase